jgi:predicted TIM-barrel fold metal-dependent hydrolase
MDAVGVEAAILFPIEDYGWAEEMCAREPHRFARVPMLIGGGRMPAGPHLIDVDAPDLEGRIATESARAGVVAIRVGLAFWPEEVARATSGGYERAFVACERLNVPVFLYATRHLDLVGPIAERHQDLTLVIDHIGLPQPPLETLDTQQFKALPELLALARHPNVAVKLCGAQSLSREAFPFRDVWPHVRELIAAFGPERLLWASDIGRFRGRIGWQTRWPRGEADYSGKHTYAESVSLYRDTGLLSDEEKHLILGGSARRLLNWRAASAIA